MAWTEFTDVVWVMWDSVDKIMLVEIWGFHAYEVFFPVTGWFLFWTAVLVMIFGWFIAFMMGGITMVVGADMVGGWKDYRGARNQWNARNSKGVYHNRRSMKKPRYKFRGW